MTVRALLFDLWGTLIHVDDLEGDANVRRKAYVTYVSATLDEVGLLYPVDEVSAAVKIVVSEMRDLHEQGRDISAPERLERLLETLQPGLPGDISREALEKLEDGSMWAVRQHPVLAVKGALAALTEARSRGLGVGLVSITGMTPGYVLRQVMDELELLELLDVMTFSDEARMAKPTEAVYACTLEALGVRAEEAVFIGDSPGPDVEAPQKLGMTAIQVGHRQEDGVTPDARIDSLEELFPALARLGLVD